MNEFGRACDTRYITRDVKRNGFKTYDYVTTEITPYQSGCRFDIVGVKSREGIVKIIEVKSHRRDFETDHKWEKYLDYATHFYFAAPAGVILPSELPDGIGLIEYSNFNNGPGYMQYTKMASRLHEIEPSKHILLLEAIIFSLNKDKPA